MKGQARLEVNEIKRPVRKRPTVVAKIVPTRPDFNFANRVPNLRFCLDKYFSTYYGNSKKKEGRSGQPAETSLEEM